MLVRDPFVGRWCVSRPHLLLSLNHTRDSALPMARVPPSPVFSRCLTPSVADGFHLTVYSTNTVATLTARGGGVGGGGAFFISYMILYMILHMKGGEREHLPGVSTWGGGGEGILNHIQLFEPTLPFLFLITRHNRHQNICTDETQQACQTGAGI